MSEIVRQWMWCRVGDRVRYTSRFWHGVRSGTVVDIQRITPAVGHDRIKIVVECQRMRRPRIIRYSSEIDDIAPDPH